MGNYLIWTSFIAMLTGVACTLAGIGVGNRHHGEAETMLMGGATLALAVTTVSFLAVGFVA